MNKVSFKYIGRHFGYPECCTDWFENRVMGKVAFTLTDEQDAVHNEKGFIPCPECAKKVYNKELKIEDLIKDRKHPLPYPEDDYGALLSTLNL